ncbi:hypothetical protein FF011L_15790 [Roseimaritima multifibrata]|uniref:Uncharacterized protein n=1 Tax=Roseimaritima multifibrata TaxID=1930274 RepID=A0A517MD64_9BACT|nr:hypothetical protein [Roseimaritima multifibrata]QDS92830.1 hypothetical protein FF011L_15790 [Roseimaritima multifibrata]
MTKSKPLIEIGIIIAGLLDEVDERATHFATKTSKEYLQEHFPDFDFNLFIVRRPELVDASVVQPSVLLQQAVKERDSRHWDYSLVLTAADLASYYTPHCLAALSRPLDAAVLSFSLIDPVAFGETTDEATRVRRVAHRLSRLMLHSLSHLSGLNSSDDLTNLMSHPDDADRLDAMDSLTEKQIEQQRISLSEVADQRLEETNADGLRMGVPAFAMRAGWINRREIIEAIAAARPWQFPRRLSGLTLASVSTVVVLLMTAEAWDLALAQTWSSLALLTAAAWLLTTGYVIIRQQLLLNHGHRPSEQTIVTMASANGIVLIGMIVMWLCLLLIGTTISSSLFGATLIKSWAASSELSAGEVGFVLKLRMCILSSSLGLLIGALGASFESQHYFRHIIFVDEEV